MFEIYSMVSEVNDHGDLVLGIKNCIELDVEMSMRDISLSS